MKKTLRSSRYGIIMMTLLSVGICVSIFFLSMTFFVQTDSSYTNNSESLVYELDKKINIQPDDIQAQSVFVIDTKTHTILFEKNANIPYPLASLVKIVTAWVVLENFPHHRVTLDEDDIALEGDRGLIAGKTWNIQELVSFMLMTSSNDAAHAIASSLPGYTDDTASQQEFVRMMNELVQSYGITTTYFLSPTGLDDQYGVTGYGTARDIAKILMITEKKYPEIFSQSSLVRSSFYDISGELYHAENTNIVANGIPSLMISKTGFTSLSGGNLAFMFEYGPQYPIAIVILGSTFQGRFDDARKIIESFY